MDACDWLAHLWLRQLAKAKMELARSGGEVLADLRHALDREGLQAYIVPTEEPHLSEIPPPCFARRKFLSGFTGSAGTCVVTEREALLWTDGRYFTQAELELSDSWQLMKSGLKGTPKLEDWLAAHLREGDCVGIDPSVHSACAAGDLKTRLGQMGIQLRPLDKNLVDGVWHDRPPMPQGELRLHPLELAGQSVEDKLHRVRSELRAQAAEVLAVTALDEVAYLFNIRGCDVERTPVALAYALVGLSSAAIFVDKGKLPPEVVAHLEAAGVEAYDYQQFVPALKASGQRVWMDTKRSNYSLLLAVGLDGPKVTLPSPISSMKVCKNTCEVDGIIAAHRRDGAAMCGALAQLKNMVTGGQTLTEVDVDLAVTEARAAQEGYVDNSFDTIAGYAANGAIVHYVAQAESAATVGMDSFLLLDSGAQYVDGTTDVTRTLHFGTPTSEERELFTRVLKAHIGLATAIFPTDLPCFALDAFARQPLWAAGLDYRHGTGHGVGAALGVHEFPPYLGQRWESRDALKAGGPSSCLAWMWVCRFLGVPFFWGGSRETARKPNKKKPHPCHKLLPSVPWASTRVSHNHESESKTLQPEARTRTFRGCKPYEASVNYSQAGMIAAWLNIQALLA
ncbi:unnamed protein product [Effrenium voratum]|nr:unnamed protein product [Effrenium voratum]